MIVKIADKEINLDPEILKFDENNINKFLQEFAGKYNFFQTSHADAQYANSKYQDLYESVYAERFIEHRENSSSDKAAEMKTKCDPIVMEAQERVRISKLTVNRINGFLRSMDKVHEDCVNTCYNMRKELGTIFKDSIKKLPYEI